MADIRLTERDKIKMGDCFRLGDLVRAKVVRSFFYFPLLLPPLFSLFLGDMEISLDSFIREGRMSGEDLSP